MKLIRSWKFQYTKYIGIFVLWDKIYPINDVIRSNSKKQSYKV